MGRRAAGYIEEIWVGKCVNDVETQYFASRTDNMKFYN